LIETVYKFSRYVLTESETSNESRPSFDSALEQIKENDSTAHSTKHPFFTFKKSELFDKVEKNLLRYHHLVSKGHATKFK
jgi:hypothetical protein